MGGQTALQPRTARIGFREFTHDIAVSHVGAPIWPQGDQRQSRRIARNDPMPVHQNPRAIDRETRIAAGGDIEADRAVALGPGVAQVEMEEARQFIEAAPGQVVLVQHQDLGPHLRSPGQACGHRHGVGREHPGLEHQDHVPVGGGEVVHIAGARQGHDLGVTQAAIRAQMPDNSLAAS